MIEQEHTHGVGCIRKYPAPLTPFLSAINLTENIHNCVIYFNFLKMSKQRFYYNFIS